MKLEKGVVSNTQLMFMVLGFLQCMILTSNFNYSLTMQDTWIAVLVAYAIAMIMLWVYTTISQKFAGSNLVQINDIVFGPYVGKFISVLYAWFFLQLMIHYSYFFNSFWITYIMPETPRVAFLVMLMFICAIAVRGGVEIFARLSFLFAILVGVMVIVIALLMIKEMKFSNLLPILQTPPKDFVQSVHILLTIPFLDIVAFLMIFPYTADNKNVRKPVMIAMSISTVLLLINVVGNMAVAGIRAMNSTSLSFAITREIDIADVLTRLDVLIALTLLVTVFIKVAVYYYATVLSLAQTLNLRSYKPLVIPIGVLALGIAIKLYPSDMEQVYAGMFVWPFNAGLFEIPIPIIMLIIIAIRKLPKKKGISE